MQNERKTVIRREAGKEPLVKAGLPIQPGPAAESRPALARRTLPAPATVALDPAPHLRTDELEAIAHMSLDELEALMNESGKRQRIDVGHRVTGMIVRVGRDNVFVDVGAKSEAMIPREDLPDAVVGASLNAFVVDVDENGILLSQRLSGSAAAKFLELAAGSDTAVEGKITARNAGGFEVRIGSARAFCPISQMERLTDEEAEGYVGKTLEFLVLETGAKTVLSRRKLIAAGNDEKKRTFWENIALGDQKRGFITSVQPFGVFVELDGAEGLIPKRELGWDSDIDPTVGFSRGQSIDVRVVDLDRENRKITLSTKDPSLSPWSKVGNDFLSGGLYTTRVVRTAEYGVFVELCPGLQVLLHASQTGKDRPKVGESVEIRIRSIDHERQRLDIVLANAPSTPATAEDTKGAIVQVTILQVLGNGLAVELEDGSTGWIPGREISLPSGTILAQRFRAGRSVQARVTEADAARRRTVLSLKLEGDEDAGWRSNAQKSGPQSLGTFADLLNGLKTKK